MCSSPKRRFPATFAGVLAVLACLLAGLSFLVGGFHYRGFRHFVPVPNLRTPDVAGFTLDLHPEHRNNPPKTIGIPNLFSFTPAPRREPFIIIRTRQDGHMTGRAPMSHMVLESITVTNENGRVFHLIPGNAPARLSLVDFSKNHGTARYGPVEGKILKIKVIGAVWDFNDTRHPFIHERNWEEQDSSRFGPLGSFL